MESKTPECGIYFNVAFEDYLQWNAVSNSRLSLIARSPAHYKRGFKKEPTQAMRIGSLMHCGQLEPLQLMARYAVMPDFANDPHNMTKDGKRSYSASTDFVKQSVEIWQRTNSTKTAVSQEEFDRLIGVCSSVKQNDLANTLFADGKPEVSMLWIDDETGLSCKARMDWFNQDGGYVVDFKTCPDCLAFTRSICKWGYDRQMAFYLSGLKKLLGMDFIPYLVCVETESPFGCRAAPLDGKFLRTGEQLYREGLRTVAECTDKNEWPCYGNPDIWECPDWHGASEEVELIIGGESLTV